MVKNALTKQGKPRLAVHHALDQLHPGYMALDLPVVDGERSSGLHSHLILFHSMRKAFQFGQVTLVDEGSPGREPLPFPLARAAGESPASSDTPSESPEERRSKQHWRTPRLGRGSHG